MLYLNDIKGLNIELSSQCTGKCPFCSRNKKVRNFEGQRITLPDFKKLPEELFTHLEWIDFGGNFGDLSTNRELPDIARHIKKLNPRIILRGDTNGSARDESWWASLGELFADGNLVFSLDGLADTHARHRIGTDFERVLKNIEAFSRAGGNAEWKFIIFKHNEHQIEEAQRLAEQIGCSRFFVISSREYNEWLQKPEKAGLKIKPEIFSAYRDQVATERGEAICKPLSNRSIYLAADKTVHPCCLAHCNYITESEPDFAFIIGLIDRYHADIDFTTTPLANILKGPYFVEVLRRHKANRYCILKCNRYRKKARRELFVSDRYFPGRLSD
jgi:MoaA/NifB/PqqE/SkfB family radical SAM enzyme